MRSPAKEKPRPFQYGAADQLRSDYVTVMNSIKPYEPPQGVIGEAPPHLAMDSAEYGPSPDFTGGWGANNFQIAKSLYEDGLTFAGYQQLAEMAQRFEYRKPCEVIAKEATREWIRFNSVKSGKDAAQNKRGAQRIKELEEELKRLRVRQVFHTQVEHALKFGIGHIWIGMKGRPLTTEGQSEPLKINQYGVKTGSVERLENLEPVWMAPNQYNSDNNLHPDYYKPRNWWLQGVLIDQSRLLQMVPFPVSQILMPSFNFGGQSLTQLLRPYVHNFLGIRNSVSSIVRNSSNLVLLTDMYGNMQTEITTEQYSRGDYNDINVGSLAGRATMMNDLSQGQRTIVADKNVEDVKVVATPLTDLDKLLAQAQEAMASVSGIPLVKMFGIQPTGLNASSDGEIRVFYDEIAAFQEAHIRPNLEKIIQLAQLNLWGEIDPDIEFEFIHLWQMDEKQAADIEKIKADEDAVLVAAGITSPEEARERQATDAHSIYRNIDLTGPPPEPPEGPEDGQLDSLISRGEEQE
ncbi:phage portal protein [Swingsia samuiensis]|uniref:phage portal protein n=1 Tax=Swingsia samuiensis TaxID=1293412 RepID=UPI0015E8D947|nr:DUF1073 domain-containing protein [Swingsia samuiensis]